VPGGEGFILPPPAQLVHGQSQWRTTGGQLRTVYLAIWDASAMKQLSEVDMARTVVNQLFVTKKHW
jgi:hypothetical protein